MCGRRSSDIFIFFSLFKVLYLIGYGLQEEETGHYPFLVFYERALKWKIPELLAELQNSPRVESQASFIQWAMDKFEARKPKPEVDDDEGQQQLLLQHNQQMDTGEATGESSKSADSEAAELKEKKRLAAERQAKIMAQMMSAQKKFMSVHAEHFATEDVEKEDEVEEGMDWTAAEETSIACLGSKRKLQVEEDLRETCILCSEAAVVNGSATAQHLVYSCFVQKSSVIYGVKAPTDYPYVSSCGHVMHASCWREYYKNERSKENRRPHRLRAPGSFDIDKKEFLCPLCRCLSNTVMPLSQSLAKVYAGSGGPKERLPITMEFGPWLEVMRSGEVFQGPLSEVSYFREDAEKRAAFEALSPAVSRSLGPAIKDLMELFAEPLLSMELGATFQHHVWRACMYTVQSVEMVLRATSKPLRGHLSIRQSSCLAGLIRVCGLVGTGHESWTEQFSLYTTTDSLLRVNVFERLVVTLFLVPAVMYSERKVVVGVVAGQKEELKDKGAAPMEAQEEVAAGETAAAGASSSSSSAVALRGLLEDQQPAEGQCGMATGQALDYYNLRLAFVLNMIKIIIVYDASREDDGAVAEDVEMAGSAELPNLLTYYQNHNLFAGRKQQQQQRRPVTSRAIVEEVKHKSQTFLRSSCLLFHFLTGVEMPAEFECLGGDTFELMCEYLGLSANLESYFQCEQTLQFVTARAMHQDIIDLRKAVQRAAVEEEEVAGGGRGTVGTREIEERVARIEPSWLPVRRLVELPADYSDLINSVSLFTCPNSNLDDSRNPTMCLVCGKVLCSQTYCCRFETARSTVGACTFHAMSCNNEVAPFLRIRECEVMLLGMNKGCFILPPYLDEYGETDQGLRRGNPMTLCQERYNRLHLIWLSHSLHEEISRAIETANTIGPTQWQYL